MSLDHLLPRILILLGVGFLVANLLVVFQFVRFLRLRRPALLTWRGRRPPFYGLVRALGGYPRGAGIVKLGVERRPPMDAFGESMMMLYYGVALPLGLRIGRGFDEDGIWSESGFMPYAQIGGRAGASTARSRCADRTGTGSRLASLRAPAGTTARARRVLLDKIAAHDLHFTGKSLDLGAHDEKDDV